MKPLLLLRAALCLALLTVAGEALAARRIAVVVGVDRYPALKAEQQLQRAVADSRAVAAKLRAMGFEVRTAENPTLRSLDRLLTETAVRSGPGDTLLLFFAGHGLAIRGQNFLLPGDLDPPALANELAASETLRREAFLVDDVIERLRANGAANVVLMLDACRNNPFRGSEGRSIGAARGLTRQETPQGVFLLFSAGFGEEALDRLPGNDPDPNSVFTRTLVPLLDRPGLSLTDLAKEVQVGVRELASRVGHPQTPAYYDQIVGRLALAPAAPGSEADIAAPAAEPDPIAREVLAWSALPSPADAAALRGFLTAFPNGAFAELARIRLAALEAPAQRPPAAVSEPRPAVVAALPPPTDPPAPPPLDTSDLARRAQLALNRLGCEAGEADGAWGAQSRAALERFRQASGQRVPDDVGLDLVERLEAREGTVCAPSCTPREELRDGVCVARTCPSGQVLSSRGRCVREPVALRPAPVVRPAPRAPERARADRPRPVERVGGGGGSCFTFNGRRVCE